MSDPLTSNCSIILSNATSQTIKLLPVSSVGSEKRERVMKEQRKRVEKREVTAALTTFKHENYVHYFPELNVGVACTHSARRGRAGMGRVSACHLAGIN